MGHKHGMIVNSHAFLEQTDIVFGEPRVQLIMSCFYRDIFKAVMHINGLVSRHAIHTRLLLPGILGIQAIIEYFFQVGQSQPRANVFQCEEGVGWSAKEGLLSVVGANDACSRHLRKTDLSFERSFIQVYRVVIKVLGVHIISDAFHLIRLKE